MNMKRYFLIPMGAILFTTILTACEESLRNEEGEIEDAGDMSVFSLVIGDCMNDPEKERLSDVPVVPCHTAHEYEVFALVYHPGNKNTPYPGADELGEVGFDLCRAEFYDYVGKYYSRSRLGITMIYPTLSSWKEANDREIACLLYDIDTTYMRGSMKGSRR